MSTIDPGKMTISQIADLIAKNNGEINLLHNRIRELNNQSSYLSEIKQNRFFELFTDYIELGTKLDLTTYANFSGVQTGIKKSEPTYSPSFTPGDVIEFTKKNKKSIVITCLTKVMSNIDRSTGIRKTGVINPNLNLDVALEPYIESQILHFIDRVFDILDFCYCILGFNLKIL
jgi:hypothetical protein